MFNVIKQYESASQPGTYHTISADTLSSRLRCSCKGFQFSPSGTCRHIKQFWVDHPDGLVVAPTRGRRSRMAKEQSEWDQLWQRVAKTREKTYDILQDERQLFAASLGAPTKRQTATRIRRVAKDHAEHFHMIPAVDEHGNKLMKRVTPEEYHAHHQKGRRRV